MSRKEFGTAIILTVILIFSTVFMFRTTPKGFDYKSKNQVVSSESTKSFFDQTDSNIFQSSQRSHRARPGFRKNTDSKIVTNFPKSPFTLIVPSDSTLEKQIFMQNLASAKEYTQIEHLLRHHFKYEKTNDIETFQGKEYPFWYCIDSDGTLFYVDGKEVSPYDFVVKRKNKLSSIMVAIGLNAEPCSNPDCFFRKVPENYYAFMNDEEYIHLSIEER